MAYFPNQVAYKLRATYAKLEMEDTKTQMQTEWRSQRHFLFIREWRQAKTLPCFESNSEMSALCSKSRNSTQLGPRGESDRQPFHLLELNQELGTSAMKGVIYLTKDMKRSPLEPNSSSASHGISRILYDLKYHYSVQKSSLFVLIMSQINPFHAVSSHLFKSHFHITLSSVSRSS
jgi:hypothetical protein